MIAISDLYTGQYASETAFIEQLCAKAMLELRQRGSSGGKLVHFAWQKAEPLSDLPGRRVPGATIQVAPGEATITAEHCRTFLRDALAKARQQADEPDMFGEATE
jgi:hypothetical protein